MSLARGLEEAGVTVDSLPLESVDVKDLENYDVIAVGGPTHIHYPSKPMRDFLRKLKRLDLSNTYAIAWGTHIRHIFSGDSSKAIAKALKSAGAKVLSRISLHVEGREGPLENGFFERIRETGIRIAGIPKLSDVPLSPSKWSQKSIGGKILWLFFQLFYWAFMIAAVVGGIGAGILTLIPTAWLDYGATKPCYLGYVAHCSFTPWSSIILFVTAVFGVWGIFRGIKMVKTNLSPVREIQSIELRLNEIHVKAS
jgi:flavodoxin